MVLSFTVVKSVTAYLWMPVFSRQTLLHACTRTHVRELLVSRMPSRLIVCSVHSESLVFASRMPSPASCRTHHTLPVWHAAVYYHERTYVLYERTYGAHVLFSLFPAFWYQYNMLRYKYIRLSTQ